MNERQPQHSDTNMAREGQDTWVEQAVRPAFSNPKRNLASATALNRGATNHLGGQSQNLMAALTQVWSNLLHPDLLRAALGSAQDVKLQIHGGYGE